MLTIWLALVLSLPKLAGTPRMRTCQALKSTGFLALVFGTKNHFGAYNSFARQAYGLPNNFYTACNAAEAA